ncbi:hypothetical protein [Romboutsia sp. 1001713B170131_170501_G6]|uniref:hypothetical protein n=1 Tax=Romboutsia sp. 1001713B170131_170501_G6 TaxID=2787108 RepID=UPI0018A96FD6|nr:hypothetical protein [Romboutsia sp. 1001713B170131_170501_G6]
MYITYELFFQIFNTLIWILIPIAIYRFIKKQKEKKALINNRISNLEKRVNELENK